MDSIYGDRFEIEPAYTVSVIFGQNWAKKVLVGRSTRFKNIKEEENA